MCIIDNPKKENRSYLEVGIPKYVKDDIEALERGLEEQTSLIDCLFNELYGSINSAFWDGEINREQADYLRSKYLYGEE